MLSTGSTPWYLSAAVCPHAAPQQRAYGRSRSGTPVEPKAPCSSMPAPSRSRRQDLGESILPFCCLRKILREGPAARIAADHSCCTPPSHCTSAENTRVSGRCPIKQEAQSLAHTRQAGLGVAHPRMSAFGVSVGWAVSRVWFGTRAACTDAGTGLASRKGLVAHAPKAVRCPQSTALKRGRPPSGTQSTLTRLGLRLISATLLILRYCAMSFYKGDRAFLPLLDHLSGGFQVFIAFQCSKADSCQR
jgi:hypothetical protein